MKYLIDHRYKLLQSISSSTQYLSSIYKAGESASLKVTLDTLQKTIALLDAMTSTPFGADEQKRIQQVKTQLLQILQLPENLEECIKKVQWECQALLEKLEPFVLSSEDTIESRKLQIHECFKSLHAYNEQFCHCLENKEVLPYMQLVINDLSSIKREDLPEKMQSLVGHTIAAFQTLIQSISAEHANALGTLLLEGISEAGGQPVAPDERLETLEYLAEKFAKAQKVLSTDDTSIESLQNILRTQEVVDAVIKVTDMEFHNTELDKIKETLFVSFQNAVLEPGDTYGSRCRMVDLYQLFGHQVHKLLELLKNRG